MNTLQVGFSRVNITPPLGIGIAGSWRKRPAEGILDELEANCLCLACGDTKVAMVAIDHLGMKQTVLNQLRKDVEAATGIPFDGVYVHCTHIHTGPFVNEKPATELEKLYKEQLFHKIVDSVVLALQDLKPAKMGYAVSHAHDVAFIRRYLTKDGKVMTNPEPNDPNIVGHAGEVDERVNVLRFDREEDSVILVNFGNHPDTIGGKRISADWPGFLRKYTEHAIPGVKCLFFNGMQGDVNHENYFRKEWETINGYDYRIPQRIGRVLTGSVLQVYDKMHYVDVDSIKYLHRVVMAPTNRPKPEEVPEAKRLYEMRLNGATMKQILPDVEGMMRVTILSEARRIVQWADGPDLYPMPLSGIAIGPVAFIGVPGEGFTGIGLGLKESGDWAVVLPTCLTNGSEGYFPMEDCYGEGGYEARSANFKAGTAELICEEGKKLLKELAQ